MDGALLGRVLARCRAVGAFLAVDQCFLELTGGDPRRLTEELSGGGLLLLRALTKSYALAGLRLGYALCGEGALLERMAAAGPPWAVSVPAQAAGEIALQQFSRWPKDSLGAIRRGRERLAAGLTGLGLWVCPGDGNFLLFRGPEDLGRRLLEREHILVRDCSDYSGLGPGWFRIGVRTEEENERLLTAAARQLRRD